MIAGLLLSETGIQCRLSQTSPWWCRSVFWSTFKTQLPVWFCACRVVVLLSLVWLRTSQSLWAHPRILIGFHVKAAYHSRWFPFPNFITLVLLTHPKNQKKQIQLNILFVLAGYSLQEGGTGRGKGESLCGGSELFGSLSCWWYCSQKHMLSCNIRSDWTAHGYQMECIATSLLAPEPWLPLYCFWSLSEPSEVHSDFLTWQKTNKAKPVGWFSAPSMSLRGS